MRWVPLSGFEVDGIGMKLLKNETVERVQLCTTI